MFDRDDLRLEGDQRRTLEAGGHPDEEDDHEDAGERGTLAGQRDECQDEGSQREQDAGGEHDGAPIAPIGDVAAEEHQAQCRDGLDEAQQSQRQWLAGELPRLESHDRGDRAHAQGREPTGTQQRPELGLSEQRPRRIGRGGQGHSESVATPARPRCTVALEEAGFLVDCVETDGEGVRFLSDPAYWQYLMRRTLATLLAYQPLVRYTPIGTTLNGRRVRPTRGRLGYGDGFRALSRKSG